MSTRMDNLNRIKKEEDDERQLNEMFSKLHPEVQSKIVNNLIAKRDLTIKENSCLEYRGLVIHYSTMVERSIDDAIVEYYCRDGRQLEFIHLLLGDQFYLGKKIEMIEFIINNHYDTIISTFPKTAKELQIFRNNRNDAAHRYFDAEIEVNKDTSQIYFQHYTVKNHKTIIKNLPINTKKVFENLIEVTKIVDLLLYKIRNQTAKKVQ